MTIAIPAIVDDCLGLLAHAISQGHNRRFEQSKKAIAVAIVNAAQVPEEFRPELQAAILYCLLLDTHRQTPEKVTPELRAKAGAMLEKAQACNQLELFQTLMFEVLIELSEFRRALPFGERALAIAVQEQEAVRIAGLLWRIGGCYSKLGLRDHAAISYRSSLRIFRSEPNDPRLPVVALALGNAVRKSAPAEAEALYKEAAAIWVQKGQLESATPAWVNLGILCSDQERFQESIQYYERARQVREGTPGTPPARIGTLYNNQACCYRKMGRINEAHQTVDRALQILGTDQDGNSLASALGTKGMILRDEGRHQESLDWFAKARARFEEQPSPNVQNVIEELEHEAVALTHLNRMQEAQVVEHKLQSLRQQAGSVPELRFDSTAAIETPPGALLIEVDDGLRANPTVADLTRLAAQLHQVLLADNLGQLNGFIRIPESTTVIFYGPDAEAMFTAMEPALRADPVLAGARITIRQNTHQREVILPRQKVN